jgi:parallel beta-helix repeat protein
VIEPTDDVNSILRSHPEGTSFLLKSGTYRGLTLQPKSGQSITGEAGTVLDGEGRAPHAIGGETMANDLTLRNLKIINYTEFGIAWGGQGGGARWVIDNCEIAHNNAGIQLKGTGVTVRNSYIHNNTTHGLFGGAGNSGVVLEGNEIAYNHSQSHPGRARGGILLVHASNSVVRNNHIHNNYSFGLHFDGHQQNVRIEGNVVEDNRNGGIFYELGWSATIRNNVVRRNGAGSSGTGGDGAGIMVIGATDVTVEGNRVQNNVNGIVGRQPDRYHPDTGKLWELKNFRVANNNVTMSRGWTGIYDRVSGHPSLNANNVFSGNSYSLDSSSAERFRWGPDMMTLSEWKNIHPNDG